MSNEIEIEFEDAVRGVKFRLKGDLKVVEEYLNKYGYDTAMKEAVERPQSRPTTSIPLLEMPTSKSKAVSFPEIPKADTITAYLAALICSPWGSPGRTSTELLEAAKVHGVALSSSTLSGILAGLNSSGKIRRMKDASLGGQWKYYPPLSYATGRN